MGGVHVQKSDWIILSPDGLGKLLWNYFLWIWENSLSQWIQNA